MRGHLRKRSEGVWQLLLYVGRDGGRSRYVSRTIHKKTKKDAEKEAARIVGEWSPAEPVSVCRLSGILTGWLNDHGGIRDTTRLRYEESIRSIVRAFGDKPPAEIDWTGELKRLGGIYAPKTLRLWLTVLKQALPETRGIRPPALKRTVLHVPSVEDVQKLLASLAGTRLYVPAFLLYYGGLRRGEAIGLRWRNVRNGKLYIEEQTVRIQGVSKVRTDPKSAARVVVSPRALREVLEAEQERQRLEHLQWGKGKPSEYVCQTAWGRSWSPSRFSETWRQASPEIHPHLLRHACAAHLLESGVDVKTLSEVLGHASVAFSLDKYGGRTSEARHAAAAESLDRFSRPMIAQLGRPSRVRRVK
jgi:integrase